MNKLFTIIRKFKKKKLVTILQIFTTQIIEQIQKTIVRFLITAVVFGYLLTFLSVPN